MQNYNRFITKNILIPFLLAVGISAASGAETPLAEDKWEKMPNGVLGQTAEFEGVGGVKIAGYVRKPEGKGPFPLVIILHGAGPKARPVTADNEQERIQKAAEEADRASESLGHASSPPIPDFL